MSNVRKFAYTTGGMFTLTGGQYIGYYNIYDGAAYQGKYTQEIELTPNKSIQTVTALSNKFFNRIPTENLTLNYTLSDFIFQPGEYVNANSINVKIQKAFSNYLDTYRGCFVADTNLPYFLTTIGRVSATNYSLAAPIWVGSSTNTYMSAFSAYNKSITRSSKILFTGNRYGNDIDNHTLIVANSASVITFLTNRFSNTFNVVFSSNKIETNNIPGYNELTFNNITSIAKNNTNVYICDRGNKAVYGYDITGVLDEDRALGKKFNLINFITSDKGKFDTPELVAASDNRIFVYDNTGVIYFYDKNFNVVTSYRNSKVFNTSTPVNLSYYKINDELYILTDDFKLIILDSQANSTIKELDTTGFLADEAPLKIIFSNSNSDIFYLLTNKSLYKKFVSNSFRNIGSYSFVQSVTGVAKSFVNSSYPQNFLYDVDTYESEASYDNILLYGYDQFMNYNEKTLYNAILK